MGDLFRVRGLSTVLLGALSLLASDAETPYLIVCADTAVPRVSLLNYRVIIDDRELGRTYVLDAGLEPTLRVLDSANLNWWLESTADGPTRTPIKLRRQGVGLFHRLDLGLLKKGTQTLRLVGQDSQARCGFQFHWRVHLGPEPENLPAIAQGLANKNTGPAYWAQLVVSGTTTEKLWAALELARLRSRQQDAPWQAALAWRDAARTAGQLGAHSEVARRLATAARYAAHAGRYADASALLDQAAEACQVSDHETGMWLVEHYRGIIARRQGRLAMAGQHFDRAIKILEKTGAHEHRPWPIMDAALTLLEAGQPLKARNLLEGVREQCTEGDSLWMRSIFHSSLGWILLTGMQSGAFAPDYLQARDIIRLGLSDHEKLEDRTAIINDLSNLAYIDLLRQDLDGLWALLTRLNAHSPRALGHTRPFVALLNGELHLARDDVPAAREAFQLASKLAHETTPWGSDITWQATYGSARCLEALHQDNKAVDAYQEALGQLDAAAARMPLSESRGPFWAGRKRMIDDIVTRLATMGRVPAAFAAANYAAGSILRSTQGGAQLSTLGATKDPRWSTLIGEFSRTRERCERLRDGVPPPGSPSRLERLDALTQCRSNATSAFDRAYGYLGAGADTQPFSKDTARSTANALGPTEGLIVAYATGAPKLSFLATRQGVRVRTYDTNPLHIWSAETRALEHIYLVTSDIETTGSFIEPDGEGTIALERFGLSLLPYAELVGRKDSRTPKRSELIVVDPSSNLSHARRAMLRWAESRPHAEILLQGQATRNRVLDKLRESRMFLFTGHGGGSAMNPWSCYISMSDGRLTAADVLATRSKLDLAILNACEAGDQGTGLPLGFASSMILAGTKTVLAPVRKVETKAATRFIRHFLQEGGAEEPGRAFRATALALRGQGDPIWTAFRLYGRP